MAALAAHRSTSSPKRARTGFTAMLLLRRTRSSNAENFFLGQAKIGCVAAIYCGKKNYLRRNDSATP